MLIKERVEQGAQRGRSLPFVSIQTIDRFKTLRNVLSVPYVSLTKGRITHALRRLGELAAARHACLEVSLYGGAVFTVVYGSRESTKDVDAIVQPSELATELAAQVAREQGLPDDWLKDDARFFLAEKEAKRKLKETEFGPRHDRVGAYGGLSPGHEAARMPRPSTRLRRRLRGPSVSAGQNGRLLSGSR